MSGAPRKGQQRQVTKVMVPVKPGQLTPSVVQKNIILRYPSQTPLRTIAIAPKPAPNIAPKPAPNIAPKPAPNITPKPAAIGTAKPTFILASPGSQFQTLTGQNLIFKSMDNKTLSEKNPAHVTNVKTATGQKLVITQGQKFILQKCPRPGGGVTFKLPHSQVQTCTTEIKKEPLDESSGPQITSIMGDLHGNPFIIRTSGTKPPPLAPISKGCDTMKPVLLPRIPSSQIATPKVPLIAKQQQAEDAKKQRNIAPKPYVPVSRMCRVCGMTDQPMVSIFSPQGAKLSLAAKIALHLPIEVDKKDKLPLRVCELCVSRLNMCHEMTTNCVEVNKMLSKQLQEEQAKEQAKKAAGKEPIPLLLIEGEAARPQTRKETAKSPGKLRVVTDKLVSVDKSLPQPEQIAQVIEAVKAGLGTQQSVSLDTLFKSVVQKGISDQPEDVQTSSYTCKLCKENLPDWFTLIEHQLLKFRCRTCSSRFCSAKQRKLHHASQHKKSRYGCSTCRSKFVQRKQLTRHKLKYHPVTCECCGKNFADRAKITSHIKRKLKEKSFNCRDCGKECGNLKSYTRHMENNQCIFRDKGEVFQCQECKRHFSTAGRLEEHKKLHLPEFPKFVCNICGKLFMTAGTLKRHSVFHAEKPFECPICYKKYSLNSQLKYHMEAHESAYKYQCDFCDRKLLHRVHLIKHITTLHLEKIEYQCVICNLGLPTVKDILSHISLKHTEDEKANSPHINLYRKITEHRCKVCDKYLGSRAGLVRHLKIHDGNVSEPMFMCEMCGKHFKSTSGLYNHRRTHAGTFKNTIEVPLKRYQCNFCEERFSTTSQLTAHISKHTGVKPYSCHFCERKFTTKQTLCMHELRHKGSKRHVCNVCGKRFYEKFALTCHMRIHSRHAPHKCHICTKSFLRRSNLTAHIRVHTGEKPYSCPVCSHSFTQKCSLDKHMCIHTQEKLYKCDLCGFSCDKRRIMTEHEISEHNIMCDKYGVLRTSENMAPVSYEIHIINEEEVV